MTEIPKKGENEYNVQKVPVKVSWNVLFHPQDTSFLQSYFWLKEKKENGQWRIVWLQRL